MANTNVAQKLGLDEDGFIDERKLPEPEVGDAPISGERYYSEEFMQKEWDHVWTKVWLVAGLEEQVPNPGDRMTFDIGKESLLCTRDNDGKIRVFYNVCQHRGNKLVHEETSSGKTMACAYHGWRYKVDGRLASVPQPEDYEGNPCEKLRLKELPSAVCGGFIWYSMDDDVMSLEEYLGPVHAQIQTYDLKRMKRTHWVTVDCDFNWKIVQDNFNESYHLPFVHPSTKYNMEQSYKHCQMDIFEKEGHARMFMPGSRPTLGLKGNYDETLRLMQGDMDFWGLDGESFRDDPHSIREAMQKVRREKGAEKGFDYSGLTDNQLTDHYHYTIFPNFSVSLKPDGAFFLMATPHPTDPTRCFFDGWFLNWFPEDAKEYYSATMLEMVDFDTVVPHITGTNYEVSCGKVIDEDMAIWSSQQKGLMSKGYDGGYLSGQEKRVRFFHEELDRHIARGEAGEK